jgi:hypothetical protein
MIRKIWLTNSDNSQKFEFTDFGSFIFSSPTSLGIYRQKEFLIVNNQRIEVNDVPSFKAVTGTIIIKAANKDLESKYATLRDFISKYNDDGFRLYVQTQENKPARYINCAIESLDKTEKATANTMLVPVTILPKSLWQGDVDTASVVQSVNVEGAFRFSTRSFGNGARFISRPLTNEFGNTIYSVAFTTGSVSKALLFNAGEETTPLVIRVYGEAVNPFIKLRDFETGEVLQSAKFNDLTIDKGYYLEINANPDKAYMEVVSVSTGERRDVSDYVQQDSNAYLTLPMGNYVLEATDDVPTNAVSTRVFFTNQYKGA